MTFLRDIAILAIAMTVLAACVTVRSDGEVAHRPLNTAPVRAGWRGQRLPPGAAVEQQLADC